jgi:ATP-dependent helicase/nuclease subunit A
MTERRDQLVLELDASGSGAAVEASRKPATRPRDEPGPSDEQLAVLDFDTDLVVAAGAGAGKTRTIVDLYLRILEEPSLVAADDDTIGPSRILCLTFTERAAREIQARVRGGILDRRWLRELESAPIQTFHAWCARLLREHPLEAGIDPRFAILTEEAADDLLRRTAIETLRRGIESGDEPARIAVELLGLTRAVDRLALLVQGIRTAGWGPRQPVVAFEARVEQSAIATSGPLAAAVETDVESLAACLVRGTPAARRYLADLEDAFSAWRANPSVTTARDLEAAVKAVRGGGTAPAKSSARDALDAWIGRRIEVEHAPQMGVWPALAVSVRAAYRAGREARGALDYDDLLLRVRRLLDTRKDIARAVRARYRVVLVDEHQDTDPVQHEILRALVGKDALRGKPASGDPRWCVVGDLQQAIYGFRGASAAMFGELVLAAEGRGALRRLAFNYRSRREIITFHNAFFPQVLTEGPHAEAIAYTAQRMHRPPSEGLAVEVLLPVTSDRPAAAGREVEARAVAARIRAMCDPASPDAKRVYETERDVPRVDDGVAQPLDAWRDARPGDVVVLLRKLTQVEPYRRTLQAAGLEPVVVGSGEFYARQELFDVLNALEAALAPEDPIPLVAFLRSPMVGLPDDSVWRLARRWDRSATTLASHVETVRNDALDREDAHRWAEGHAILEELRDRADREPVGATVAWLVDRTGYAAVLDALPDRAQRRANLSRILALADRAAAEGAPLLADWAALVRRRADRPPRDRDAALPVPGDRVLLMTIHQSKGLEFPIVVLADLGATTPAGLGGVAFDPDRGVVSKWWPDSAAKPVPTPWYREASAARRDRERLEEARLLYVAATRARDHLVLSAGAAGSQASWWLGAARSFVESEAAAGLVAVGSLESWAERHSHEVPPAAEVATGTPWRAPLEAAPGEVSAREIAAALVGEAPPPGPAREAIRAAMRRGELVHRALERLPLPPPVGFDLPAWLARRGVEPATLAECVAQFVTERVWPRLAGAVGVWREIPFRLRLPDPGGVVVGTIDCLWRDAEERWWVWDWKLGTEGASEELHQAQLDVYALAAARANGLEQIAGALWYVERDQARERSWDRGELETLAVRLAGAFRQAVERRTPTAS